MPPKKPLAKGKTAKPAAKKPEEPVAPKQTPEEAQTVIKALIANQNVHDLKGYLAKRSLDIDKRIRETATSITQTRTARGLPAINAGALVTSKPKTDMADGSIAAGPPLPPTDSPVPDGGGGALPTANVGTSTAPASAATPVPPIVLPPRTFGHGKTGLFSPYGLVAFATPTSALLGRPAPVRALPLISPPSSSSAVAAASAPSAAASGGEPGSTVQPVDGASPSPAATVVPSASPPSANPAVVALCAKIGKDLGIPQQIPAATQGTSASPPADLLRVFAEFDAAATGSIPSPDFRDALMLRGYDATKAEEDALVDAFRVPSVNPADVLGSRHPRVDYRAFAAAVEGGPVPPPLAPQPTAATSAAPTLQASLATVPTLLGTTAPDLTVPPAYPLASDLQGPSTGAAAAGVSRESGVACAAVPTSVATLQPAVTFAVPAPLVGVDVAQPPSRAASPLVQSSLAPAAKASPSPSAATSRGSGVGPRATASSSVVASRSAAASSATRSGRSSPAAAASAASSRPGSRPASAMGHGSTRTGPAAASSTAGGRSTTASSASSRSSSRPASRRASETAVPSSSLAAAAAAAKPAWAGVPQAAAPPTPQAASPSVAEHVAASVPQLEHPPAAILSSLATTPLVASAPAVLAPVAAATSAAAIPALPVAPAQVPVVAVSSSPAPLALPAIAAAPLQSVPPTPGAGSAAAVLSAPTPAATSTAAGTAATAPVSTGRPGTPFLPALAPAPGFAQAAASSSAAGQAAPSQQPAVAPSSAASAAVRALPLSTGASSVGAGAYEIPPSPQVQPQQQPVAQLQQQPVAQSQQQAMAQPQQQPVARPQQQSVAQPQQQPVAQLQQQPVAQPQQQPVAQPQQQVQQPPPASTSAPSPSPTMMMPVPLMHMVPVSIVMGPAGPMAIPMQQMQQGNDHNAGLSTSGMMTSPGFNVTSNGFGGTATQQQHSASQPDLAAAAEREVALLTKLRTLMTANESLTQEKNALRDELMSFDDGFFEAIEDTKYRLAVAEGRVKPEPDAAAAAAVAAAAADGATSASAAASAAVPSSASTTDPSSNPTATVDAVPTAATTTQPQSQSQSHPPQPAEGEALERIPAGLHTSANIETGLTAGRKMMDARWDGSPPRAALGLSRTGLPASLVTGSTPAFIGAPMSPDGRLPMIGAGAGAGAGGGNGMTTVGRGGGTSVMGMTVTGAVSRASPVRAFPLQQQQHVPDTGLPAKPGVSTQQQEQPQQQHRTASGGVLPPVNDTIAAMRSAWNAVAYATTGPQTVAATAVRRASTSSLVGNDGSTTSRRPSSAGALVTNLDTAMAAAGTAHGSTAASSRRPSSSVAATASEGGAAKAELPAAVLPRSSSSPGPDAAGAPGAASNADSNNVDQLQQQLLPPASAAPSRKGSIADPAAPTPSAGVPSSSAAGTRSTPFEQKPQQQQAGDLPAVQLRPPTPSVAAASRRSSAVLDATSATLSDVDRVVAAAQRSIAGASSSPSASILPPHPGGGGAPPTPPSLSPSLSVADAIAKTIAGLDDEVAAKAAAAAAPPTTIDTTRPASTATAQDVVLPAAVAAVPGGHLSVVPASSLRSSPVPLGPEPTAANVAAASPQLASDGIFRPTALPAVAATVEPAAVAPSPAATAPAAAEPPLAAASAPASTTTTSDQQVEAAVVPASLSAQAAASPSEASVTAPSTTAPEPAASGPVEPGAPTGSAAPPAAGAPVVKVAADSVGTAAPGVGDNVPGTVQSAAADASNGAAQDGVMGDQAESAVTTVDLAGAPASVSPARDDDAGRYTPQHGRGALSRPPSTSPPQQQTEPVPASAAAGSAPLSIVRPRGNVLAGLASAGAVGSPRRSPTTAGGGRMDDGGDTVIVNYAFPHATDGDYVIRAMARRAIEGKVAALMKASSTGSPQKLLPPSTADGLTAAKPDLRSVDLLGPLTKPAKEALSLAFDRFTERDPLSMGYPRPRILPTESRMKERLRQCITPLEFERGLLSIGLRLSPDEIADLVGGLRLDQQGKVQWSDFVRFVSLPLVSDAANPPPEEMENIIVSSSPERAPRPVDALPSPSYHREPKVASPRPVYKGYVRHVPPPQRMNSPWAYAGPDARHRKPRVHVPWPVDISKADCAFWPACNALEAAVLKEVRRRADVAGVYDQGLAEAASGGNRGTFDLRRSFTFFDRRGRKVVGIDDLHATLADLGLVDPPDGFTPREGDAGLAELMPQGRLPTPTAADAAAAAAGAGIPASLPPADETAQLIGLSSPPRRRPLGSANTAAVAPSSPGGFASVPSSSFQASLIGHGFAGMAASMPPQHLNERADDDPAIDLQADVAGAELAAGSRALVVRLFRRMHGETDPGNTGASLVGRGDHLVSEAGGTAQQPLTYNLFARWAAPLNTRLRRIRERVQSEFLAQATIGGGAKDFARAFRRVDRNGDGVMSVSEFKATLGPIARSLDPFELQALCDYFDVDGSGQIDFKEFLGISAGGHGSSMAKALADEMDEEDEFAVREE